ncbi:tyrosine-type recombinase/integrase [Bacillus timonensis]|uniref:tyrosine-type recombinase/integrase n=1 Tax=Bacillus timonensis TaxID=1033734 RepID=UPI000287BBFE|nr:site-specific integrase [Bacillus timonensis]
MANFRKLASGKWQARIHKDGKLVSLGTFRTKKEAEIEAAKVEERKYYGQTINDRNMLFDEVVEDWLEHKKANVKPTTFKQIEVIIRNHVLPTFGHKKIMTIHRPEIKRWIATFGELDENGKDKYSFGSRLKYLSYMKSILHYAVHELEVLEKNPADKLKVSVQDSVAIKKEKVKYFSLGELNQLLDFMKTYKHQRFPDYQLYHMLMLFLSKTGLRISEALALRWEDINGDKVTINKQTSRDDNNTVTLITLKNSSSYRTIKIDNDLVRELKKFRMKQNELILGNPRFRKNEDGIIFQNYNGHYLTPSTIRETMQDYCKKAGVDYKGTHGFRHTHAVLLLESGASLKYVSNRLGHKTIKTTADTYLDITEKIEEDELQKFASYTKR